VLFGSAVFGIMIYDLLKENMQSMVFGGFVLIAFILLLIFYKIGKK